MTPQTTIELLDGIADRLADRVCERLRAGEIRPRLLSVAEAGVYLKQSRRGIKRLIASRALPCVRNDRRTLLDIFDCDRWIRSRKAVAADKP